MRGNDIFFPHDYENENDNPLTGGILVGYSMDRGG
jgi:hypothetical protein